MTDKDTKALMTEFAAQLLRHNDDAGKAAFAMTPDVGLALQWAKLWPKDAFVLAEKERLLGTSLATDFLPTKEQQAKAVYILAEAPLTPVEDRLKAHRLYAELRGFIEKPNAGSVNILSQGVMIVKEAGSDSEWAERARLQQRALTHVN